MKKVLIIDKDLTLTERIKNLLANNNYTIITQTEKKGVFAIIHSEKPDLIIIGAEDKEIDEALKLIDEIKKFNTQTDMPVLFSANVTNYSGYRFDPADTKNYLPVDDFIERDFEPTKLLKLVNNYLMRDIQLNGSM